MDSLPPNRPSSPWDHSAPLREDCIGNERLEQHAEALAVAQSVSPSPPARPPLSRRLEDNAAALLEAYRANMTQLAAGGTIAPAAEWLLDNYHVVETQIRGVHADLPPGFYRQLPKLAAGPLAGYPRVLGLAWAYVAHTDSYVDPDSLRRFILAYQRVQPLTIGELWAVSITLRVVLIENLRRLADQIRGGNQDRADANGFADQLLTVGRAHTALLADIAARPAGPVSELFAAQLSRRLRSQDPKVTPALAWLNERLEAQGATIDGAVLHAQQRQGSSNVTVRNIVTSMRLISDLDWAEMFESVSLVDVQLREGSEFGAMDFPSRNLYRNAIEVLARHSPLTEVEVAVQALAASHQTSPATDPGLHLLAEGRLAFERAIGFRPPVRLRIRQAFQAAGIGAYVGAIFLAAAALLILTLWATPGSGLLWPVLFVVAALVPATELATALVNRTTASLIPAHPLPCIELMAGVPTSMRTLLVVPTLLTSRTDLLGQIERLEVHHLAGPDGDIAFALLLDGLDAATEHLESDAPLLALAAKEIDALNHRYEATPACPRFLLLHRRRVFDPSEGVWMGWERKRGKLHELNRLLRGATDTTFVDPVVPPDVRWVITLDSDTRLPRNTILRLIGKMAHPLNHPRFDPALQRVTGGYAILQPRVTPWLPVGRQGSFYERAFSGPGGVDPYGAAVSDVYQDLFSEGSYTGKGIYDVDAFEAALAGRIPENAVLSHDLFEGAFARAALVSDVEVVEEFPSRYDVVAKRQHRWTRGDWQLLPWVLGFGAGRRGVPALGRWKMIDNLRRSLVAPCSILTLALCWFLPWRAALPGTALILAVILVPTLIPPVLSILASRADARFRDLLETTKSDLLIAATQILLSAAFLADQAWRMADAIARALWRVFFSRQHLLEWTPAAASMATPRLGLPGFYRRMAGGSALGVLVALPSLASDAWPIALPFAALWLAAPAVAVWASRSPKIALAIVPSDAQALRLIARRTWRYFETFVTPANNMLPPDNVQEDPKALVATRTSPTNIGLYFLSIVAARDFGWIGTTDAVERLEATFASLGKLQRHKGHFLNWYDTTSLRTLNPAYVSSVDSGNLAGHLIALANACDEWVDAPPSDVAAGLRDAKALASQAAGDELAFWTAAVPRRLAEQARDEAQDTTRLNGRLTALAATARAMALGMDFGFLLNRDRRLLSIGYSLSGDVLDTSCYDLLASECRLGSLFAIAKGDVETRHWFRLGRAFAPTAHGSALVSWSGTMFEYLMPSLVMRCPVGSLLEQTMRLVVARQQEYGRTTGTPWGISESAYSARDLDYNYQYSNFGVPGLGLKRGLADNLVVAPYATALAAMVDPAAARENFARLETVGALGQHGFYEALDYTSSRLPAGETVVIVRSYMAHHQGMTIVAIANALQDGRMRARFHREPIIEAAELLLQERVPRTIAVSQPPTETSKDSGTAPGAPEQTVRRVTAGSGPPETHLLSNGRYTVMLTGAGGGLSQWQDMAVTRWREDTTRDDWGSFVFLRDVDSGAIWSAAGSLGGFAGGPGDHAEVLFAEDHAEYIRHHGTLTSTMDVIVSGEHDGEVRRVCVFNSGDHTVEIELTSYAEIVLEAAAKDSAHPAFAKMFVQTQLDPTHGALIATRRSRSHGEQLFGAAHFAVVDAETVGETEYETDRTRFIGRGRTVQTAIALGQPLSNTVGTVLDPVFALRYRVRIAPGKVARIAFWTVVALCEADLLSLVDQHRETHAYDRAKTLAWTQAQVQLRHLGIDAEQAADFQRLAAPILYADARFRAGPAALASGAGPQSGLWRFGISGDLPIVLFHIGDADDIDQLRQILRANEYWQLKRLPVDLVIINEREASYIQDLQIAIETAIRSNQASPRPGELPALGSVIALRADLMDAASRSLLRAAARVDLTAHDGSIADHLARIPAAPLRRYLARNPVRTVPAAKPPLPHLEFFNGLGGFAEGGREYVTILDAGRTTPAPWVNVVANPSFGFQASADGSGYTWAENSKENQLTAWSNDPTTDPSAEAIYVRDEATGALWTPTAQPIRDEGTYTAHHGFGTCRFMHEANGVALDLLQFVPMSDPVKISRLTLRNLSAHPRRLTVTGYVEWVLGTARGTSAPYVITEWDAGAGAILARKPWNTAFPGRVAFAALSGPTTGWTADRTEFLGRHGTLATPAALLGRAALSGAAGAGLDPCAALQTTVDLAPGQTAEVVLLLGQCASADLARALVTRIRAADLDTILADVRTQWSSLLGAVQVKTPDRAMDIMLNGWLLYQTIACRVWARSAFYQASGAYGFRDQLQDGMALSFADPAETRRHLLRAAARQFIEGDVQHWWLPHSGGRGVRTHISDDRVWLAYAATTYILASGDAAVLDETVPFLEGPILGPGEHDHFFEPTVSATEATLFEHCARALDQVFSRAGANGLPLIGTGDWNDGMSRVGAGGRGESVWLAWLLVRTIDLFEPLIRDRDPARAARWTAEAATVRAAIEQHAWDGAWYRRATYDDGTWLGAADQVECRIDSIAQSWAVLAGATDPARAAQAMQSLETHLIRSDDRLALLFTKPFDTSAQDPGYIKGYPPGLRENGGQYTHAATWTVLAFTRLHQGDKAYALFAILNPIDHARTPEAVERYKVEPYVIAADIYSVPPHVGRGGWTWYTGSAGWMYRAGVEGILGLRREAAFLVVDPCIPAAWPGFEATVTLDAAQATITVLNCQSGPAHAVLDGLPCSATPARIPLDGKSHSLVLSLPSGDTDVTLSGTLGGNYG